MDFYGELIYKALNLGKFPKFTNCHTHNIFCHTRNAPFLVSTKLIDKNFKICKKQVLSEIS